MRDYLPGGRADKKKSGFIRSQLREGTKHEMEHTNDPRIAKEVAQDHLAEDPHYYTKLKKMEKEGSFSSGLNKVAVSLKWLDRMHRQGTARRLTPKTLASGEYASAMRSVHRFGESHPDLKKLIEDTPGARYRDLGRTDRAKLRRQITAVNQSLPRAGKERYSFQDWIVASKGGRKRGRPSKGD